MSRIRRPSRRALGLLAAALGSSACHSNTTVTGPTSPAAFTIKCDITSLVGCGSTTCTVTAAQAVSVRLACTTGSSLLTCGVGPSDVALKPGESRVIGLTLSGDPLGSGGWTPVSVVGTGLGQVQRGDVAVQVGHSLVREPSPGAMVVAGCAGYLAGVLGPDQVQRFGGPIVGAWRGPAGSPGAFCVETYSFDDGRFELEVPRGCVAEGAPVTLTAGGLNTCVQVPFQAGRKSHAVLLGRRERSCP